MAVATVFWKKDCPCNLRSSESRLLPIRGAVRPTHDHQTEVHEQPKAPHTFSAEDLGARELAGSRDFRACHVFFYRGLSES